MTACQQVRAVGATPLTQTRAFKPCDETAGCADRWGLPTAP